MKLAKEPGKTAWTFVSVFFIFFDGTIECLTLLENVVLDQDLASLHLLLVSGGSLQLFLLLLIVLESYRCARPFRCFRPDELFC